MPSFDRIFQIFIEFSGYLIAFFILTIILVIGGIGIYRSSRPKLFKKISLSILFTLFLIISFFCCAEAYFRFVYDESDALGFLQTNKHWFAKHVAFNNFYLRDNKNYTLQKKPGVTRIGVVGDSFAFGYGIKNVENRFSNLLEKKLLSQHKNVEVYNLGISGVDTCDEIQEFEKRKDIQFDIIIWEFYLNDIQPCKSSKLTKILNEASARNRLLQIIVKNSYFADFMYWRIYSATNNTLTALRDADLQQYRNPEIVKLEAQSVLTLSALLSGETKTRPVIAIIFPHLGQLGPKYPAKGVHKMVHQMFNSAGVTKIVDMLTYLQYKTPDQVMVNQFDPHPNEEVNKLAADKLDAVILSLIK